MPLARSAEPAGFEPAAGPAAPGFDLEPAASCPLLPGSSSRGRGMRKIRSEMTLDKMELQFDPLERGLPGQSPRPCSESVGHRRTRSVDYIVPIPRSKVSEGMHKGDTLPELGRGLSLDAEEDESWGDQNDVEVPPLPGSLRFPSMPGRPNKLAVVMVGLPARGKSFIGRKVALQGARGEAGQVCRFLVWMGHKTRVFNVGEYRRELEEDYVGAEFFDPNNAEAKNRRHKAADLALTDMIDWLQHGGQVALFDATNSTQSRRDWVRQRVHDNMFQVSASRPGLSRGQVMFLESYCDDPLIIEKNIQEHKVKSADYKQMTVEEATMDFKVRLAHYEEQYQTISSADESWIKIINAGTQIVVNNIRGYTPPA